MWMLDPLTLSQGINMIKTGGGCGIWARNANKPNSNSTSMDTNDINDKSQWVGIN